MQERQVLPEKSEILYGAMSGDPATRGNEDEGVEPDELGTRMVGHGDCVSVANFPGFGTPLILEAILYCR